jgi:mxaA protein
MNSSEEVKTIALPAVSMQFQGAASGLEQTVSEWPITVAPVTPTYVLAREGLEELRPDAVPMPLDVQSHRMRLGAYAVALGAIMLGWIAGRFGVPFSSRSRGPFAQALRDLRALTRKPNDANTYQATLRRVHRAFDQTAGHVLFAQQLDQFFVEHPRFGDLRALVAQFFELSQQEFFGSSVAVRKGDWLLDFCRQCRDRERALA